MSSSPLPGTQTAIPSIAELLSHVDKLPPSPQVLPQLLELLNDDNSSFDEIVQLVSIDLSLAAQVLRLSNSAYYGAPTKTYDLADAVQRIGLREVYRIIAMICGRDLLGSAAEGLEMGAGDLWKFSLSCALAMESMVELVGLDCASTAYTIGLLHAIGKIVLSVHFPSHYKQVFELVDQGERSIATAERSIFTFDNAEVAGALLKKWDFKDIVAIPITYQYKPKKAPDYQDLASMLHLSMWIAANIGFSCGRHAWAIEMDPEAIHMAHIKEELLHGLLITVSEKMEQLKMLMPMD
jgi:HD-like signal output (HDOD) protein